MVDALLARVLELQGMAPAAAVGPTATGGNTNTNSNVHSNTAHSDAVAPSPGGSQQQTQQQQQEAAAASEELSQCLLALHALCVADPRLLHRPADPQRVVRSLAPYVKVRCKSVEGHTGNTACVQGCRCWPA